MPPRAAARARMAAARGSQPYAKRRQVNARPTQWEFGNFVAVDGEGFSEGTEWERIVGVHKTRYTGKSHYYAFLAASDGSEIYSPSRLNVYQSLSFLCGIVENDPRAILVAFGGSYDVCQMVAYDLNEEQISALLGKGVLRSKLILSDADYTYALEYRPRKCLTIQRWRVGEKRWITNTKGKRVASPHLTVRLWDVWGFFQDSFVGVLKKWVPGDADYDFVSRMKGERSIFERGELEEIRRYNAAELRLLVKVMDKVRAAINDLGLKITRWDGAGAIAAAMMTHHRVKDHKAELPPDVFEAARCAYSGGHIESCKVGYHAGAVHHYDVNSAYPSVFVDLPSLAGGHWVHGTGAPPPGYTLVKTRWNFKEAPFYPLFYRSADGSILYPQRGCGWHWFPEYSVARAFNEHDTQTGGAYEVLEWWNFRALNHDKPFGWVRDYYQARQDYVAAAKSQGVESGPEKIIKLGLNSLYGKTAQQLGARVTDEGELRLPPFFQLDWAGYVTAGCRAQLMQAALQQPHAIIGFATDGLFSTEPLDVYRPAEKILGAWDYQRHDGITMVMPGVYWLHDGETMKNYSRGFDKKNMNDAHFVHRAWQQKQDAVPVALTRLIGLGSALASKEYWQMRGTFAATTRTLCLDGDNSKRYPINLARDRPHLGLVDTIPRDHFLPNLFGIPDSAPFPVAWIDGNGDVNRDTLEGELADELEAMDAALA